MKIFFAVNVRTNRCACIAQEKFTSAKEAFKLRTGIAQTAEFFKSAEYLDCEHVSHTIQSVLFSTQSHRCTYWFSDVALRPAV